MEEGYRHVKILQIKTSAKQLVFLHVYTVRTVRVCRVRVCVHVHVHVNSKYIVNMLNILNIVWYIFQAPINFNSLGWVIILAT